MGSQLQALIGRLRLVADRMHVLLRATCCNTLPPHQPAQPTCASGSLAGSVYTCSMLLRAATSASCLSRLLANRCAFTRCHTCSKQLKGAESWTIAEPCAAVGHASYYARRAVPPALAGCTTATYRRHQQFVPLPIDAERCVSRCVGLLRSWNLIAQTAQRYSVLVCSMHASLLRAEPSHCKATLYTLIFQLVHMQAHRRSSCAATSARDWAARTDSARLKSCGQPHRHRSAAASADAPRPRLRA